MIIDDLKDLQHHELLRREKLLHVPADIKPERGAKRESQEDDDRVSNDNCGQPIDVTEDGNDEPAAHRQRAQAIVDLTED